MIELTEGSIMIDDVDMATLPRQDVRSRLTVLSQDPYFLTGSFRLNIDPYEEASEIAIT